MSCHTTPRVNLAAPAAMSCSGRGRPCVHVCMRACVHVACDASVDNMVGMCNGSLRACLGALACPRGLIAR